jgi:CBS domain-containing protein
MKRAFDSKTVRDVMSRQQSEADSIYAQESMSSRVVTIGPDASVAEASRTIHKAGVKSVVVIEDGEICGIVSKGDILKAWLDRVDDPVAKTSGPVGPIAGTG